MSIPILSSELKMMSFSSTKTEQVDNTGLLNGNFINNGNIVKSIDEEVHTLEKLFIIIIILLVLILIIMLIKIFVKYIKNSMEQARRIETIALRNPE